MIIVIDHNTDAQEQIVIKNKTDTNFHVLSIKPLDKLDDTHYRILLEELHHLLFPDHINLKQAKKDYMSIPDKRIIQVKKYIQFLKSFEQSCLKSVKAITQAEKFIKTVCKNE